jgi:hypothetical protein
MTADASDSAELPPSRLDAVTETMRRLPTSRERTSYFRCVAPGIDPQLLTLRVQLTHWNANPSGCVPRHAPGEAVTVSPSRRSPTMVGWERFFGGAV